MNLEDIDEALQERFIKLMNQIVLGELQPELILTLSDAKADFISFSYVIKQIMYSISMCVHKHTHTKSDSASIIQNVQRAMGKTFKYTIKHRPEQTLT